MTSADSHWLARWRAVEESELSWVRWHDAAAVLHRPSGKTHFLNPASVRLMALLEVAPLAVTEVAVQLARLEGVDASAAYESQVRSAVYRLGQLGLLRCLHQTSIDRD